jgi:hypothetical protein
MERFLTCVGLPDGWADMLVKKSFLNRCSMLCNTGVLTEMEFEYGRKQLYFIQD